MSQQTPDDAVPLLDEDKVVPMKTKTIGWIIVAVAIAATSWGAIKWDIVASKKEIEDHGEKLRQIDATLRSIENDARATREGITAAKNEQSLTNLRLENLAAQVTTKLDYLTGDRRGPRPASGQPVLPGN